MQLLTGVHPLAYWLSIFILDFLIVLLISVSTASAAVLTAVNHEVIPATTADSLHSFLRIFLILLLCSLSVLPLTYFASLLMPSASSGFINLILVFIIFGTAIFIFKLALGGVLVDLPELDKFLTDVLVQFPHYNFCDAAKRFFDMDDIRRGCKIMCKYFEVCNKTEQCSMQKACCGKRQVRNLKKFSS